MPWHPHMLQDGAPLIVPPHGTMLARMDAPEGDPVSGPPDSSWERYVLRKSGKQWPLAYDGNLDDRLNKSGPRGERAGRSAQQSGGGVRGDFYVAYRSIAISMNAT
jgi:hypothetical protein